MTDLRTAAQRLLDAIDRALPEAPLCSAFDVVADTADDLRDALAYREDIAQAAFEHWVETVEATQGCAISRNAVVDAVPIIKPEIKGHNAEPPPEAQTEAEKIAYCAGWWAAMEAKREQATNFPEEKLQAIAEYIGDNYHVWYGIGARDVEEVLLQAAHHKLVAVRQHFVKGTSPQEQAEPVAWRTFDGEGGYDYRTYDDNENYRDEWDRRNPNHKGWVEPLYTHQPRQWQGLTDEERDYFKALGFVGGKAVEEKLRAKNSTLACIPAVPPG